MSERLTPEREAKIREVAAVSFPFAKHAFFDLLAELDAVRADLGVERIVRDEAVRERDEALLECKAVRTERDELERRLRQAPKPIDVGLAGMNFITNRERGSR